MTEPKTIDKLTKVNINDETVIELNNGLAQLERIMSKKL